MIIKGKKLPQKEQLETSKEEEKEKGEEGGQS